MIRWLTRHLLSYSGIKESQFAERLGDGRGPECAVAKALWRVDDLETAGRRSSARGYIAVRMAALEEMPQPVARLLERVVKVVDSLDFGGHFSRVEIGNQFAAEVCGAANAVRYEHRNDLAVIAALELKFP